MIQHHRKPDASLSRALAVYAISVLAVASCSSHGVPSAAAPVAIGRSALRDDASPYGVNVNLMDPPNWAARYPAHIHPTYADHRKYLGLWKAAGIKWLRVGIHWADLADATGTLKHNAELERVDSTVAMAQDSGFAILAMIGHHAFAEPSVGQHPGYPTQESWARFVTQILAHNGLGQKIRYWELYNELNCNNALSGAGGLPVSGREYGDLVNTAAPIIHANNGLVVAGALAWNERIFYPQFPNTASQCAATPQFLTDMMNQAAANIDIVSLHSYGTAGAIIDAVKHAHDLLPGSWSRPIWLTEFGGVDSSAVVNSVVIRDVILGNRVWAKAFVWHGYHWTGGDQGRALLRPRDSVPGANRQFMYSNPTPSLPYVAYRNAILGCAFQNFAVTGCYSPPAYTVSLSTPDKARPGAQCKWIASASPEGFGPFTYSWHVGAGQPAGSQREYVYTNSGTNFTVSVSVVDALGRVAHADRSVRVQARAPKCAG